MLKQFEKIFGIYIQSLFEEGSRYSQIKLMTAFLEGLQGVRRLAQVQLFTILTCLVMVMALFSGVIHGIYQFWNLGFFVFDAFIVGTIIVAAFCVGVLYYFLRERHWLKALGLAAPLDRLTQLPHTSDHTSDVLPSESTTRVTKNGQLSPDDLKLIQATIERAVDEAVDQKMAAQTYEASRFPEPSVWREREQQKAAVR